MKNYRGIVDSFSDAMEARLLQNDDKGGWDNEPAEYFFKRLEEEIEEVRKLIDTYDPKNIDKKAEITEEAADIANFALMIADRFGV